MYELIGKVVECTYSEQFRLWWERASNGINGVIVASLQLEATKVTWALRSFSARPVVLYLCIWLFSKPRMIL